MRGSRILALLGTSLLFCGLSTFARADVASLPAGTRLYLVTDVEVTSTRGESDVGAIVPCRVWRDVESGGVLFIKSGTLAGCRIDKLRRRNIGGVQGQVSIGGIETKSVDGQQVMLSGGYNRAGSSRKAAVWGVGLLVFWPALFVPGGAAELPPGTVFDVNTVNDLNLEVASEATSRPSLNLSAITDSYSAEILLDDLLKQSKPETLRIKVIKDKPLPSAFMIDSVNGKQIEPLPLMIEQTTESENTAEAILAVKIKTLAKHFQKGINRFEIAYDDAGERRATELVLDVQM